MNKKGLKKIYIFASIFLILIVAVSCLKQREKITNYLEMDFKGEAILLFVLDSRSEVAVNNVENVFKFVDQNNIQLNVGIVYVNKKTLDFKGKFRVYKKKKLERFKFGRNMYILMNSEGEIIKKGYLLFNPLSLLKTLADLYSVPVKNSLPEELEPGNNIKNAHTFRFLNGKYLLKKYNCFVFHEDICFGCMSGIDLLKFAELQHSYPLVNFAYVTFSDYTSDDIKRIKKNNDLRIEIIVPDASVKAWWKEIKGEMVFKPTLIGTKIIIEKNGLICFLSSDSNKFLGWLGNIDISKKNGGNE